MSKIRDRQREKVYAFERAASRGAVYVAEWDSIQECSDWLKPIWRAERGRYGRATVEMPLLRHAHWGQTRPKAHSTHQISLPKFSRNSWIVLHEAAHRLNVGHEAHGARFVGMLMGLLVRHANYEIDYLTTLAEEMGVKYSSQSIGALPVVQLHQKLERLMPVTDMDAACELEVHWRQIRGAALKLIGAGRARWFRGRLVALQSG